MGSCDDEQSARVATGSDPSSTPGEVLHGGIGSEGMSGAVAERVRDRLELWLRQSAISGNTESFYSAPDGEPVCAFFCIQLLCDREV